MKNDSEPLATRVRGEYAEMPGLRLTVAQACRLWQMDAVLCEAVLQTLVTEGFLVRTRDNAFVALPATPTPLKAGGTPLRLRRKA